jgi:hypothetical protein
MDDNDYVELGRVCVDLLGLQCQYGSRYADRVWTAANMGSYPYCGEGLRITGDSGNYHGMRIHKGDVDEFVRRVQAHRNSRM